MTSISEAWAMAVSHHQAGRLQAAEQFYRQILAIEPNHVDAWNLLGVLSSQRGNQQFALDYLGRAIALDAGAAVLHNNLGNVYQTLQKTDEAVACYRRALELNPDLADAHFNLGISLQAQGRRDEAVACQRRALELKPDFAEAHNNLGNALQVQGKWDDASACYRRALELKPDFVSAQYNLGTVLHEQGKRDEAVACYRQAIKTKPDFAVAHYSLGTVLQEQEKWDEAAACYQRAIDKMPNLAEAHNNLGTVLQQQGKQSEAVACIRRALQLKPEYAEAHNNLGNALRDQGQWDAAVACCRRALELKPEFAEAHNNVGNVLRDQRNLDAAVACYRQALDLKPKYAEAHVNLGNVLQELGRRDEAVACFLRALELKPDFADAHFSLGVALREQRKWDAAVACCRRTLELKPDYLVAVSALVHGLMHLCQWDDVEVLSKRVIKEVDNDAQSEIAPPVSPFSFLTLPTATTAQQQLRCARQWANRHLKVPSKSGRNSGHNRPSHRTSKLAIGYLSADFHSHPTAMLIAELFEKHDRHRFEICGYSYGPDDDSPIRRRLVSGLDRFVDLQDASYLDAAKQIALDEIEILVDLKGYTQDSRSQIMALRPAPIQVNYLGYPGTTGARFMDYILVDDFIVPPEQQPFFTEKLVHLPGCYQVNDSRREIAPHTPSRAECGLPDEGFVFCCFNNSYKITPALFSVWMNLLKTVPGSALWLLESSPFVVANLRREAEAQGVASERLVFAPRLDATEHLARHRLADLFLDTFPVNAHTTASEALWVGCPVLTMAGETFVARVAGSLLRTLDLSELVTKSLHEYEALAQRLAQDSGQLADLRARLQANRTSSGLFDAARFAKTLEKAYLTMWDTYISGEQPRSFRVSQV